MRCDLEDRERPPVDPAMLKPALTAFLGLVAMALAVLAA
jgi:hypothetical protein